MFSQKKREKNSIKSIYTYRAVVSNDLYQEIMFLVKNLDVECQWYNHVTMETDEKEKVITYHFNGPLTIPYQTVTDVTVLSSPEQVYKTWQQEKQDAKEAGSEDFNISLFRCWSHSHVNMDVLPSGQDDKQWAEWVEPILSADDCTSYPPTMMIVNQKGDVYVRVFDPVRGIEVDNIDVTVQEPQTSGIDYIKKCIISQKRISVSKPKPPPAKKLAYNPNLAPLSKIPKKPAVRQHSRQVTSYSKKKSKPASPVKKSKKKSKTKNSSNRISPWQFFNLEESFYETLTGPVAYKQNSYLLTLCNIFNQIEISHNGGEQDFMEMPCGDEREFSEISGGTNLYKWNFKASLANLKMIRKALEREETELTLIEEGLDDDLASYLKTGFDKAWEILQVATETIEAEIAFEEQIAFEEELDFDAEMQTCWVDNR